jgi:outer membrane protein assembly factor BamE
VRQGNFVTQEMVAQLKPGLSREQVRFILGSPLVADMFHADRWDYVYRYQQGHGEASSAT